MGIHTGEAIATGDDYVGLAAAPGGAHHVRRPRRPGARLQHRREQLVAHDAAGGRRRCATWASTGSRTWPTPERLFQLVSEALAAQTSRRCGRSSAAQQPAGPADQLRRPRGAGRGAPRCWREHAPADADRPGRHRQDAPGAPAGGRSERRVPRRRLLRRPRRRSPIRSSSRRAIAAALGLDARHGRRRSTRLIEFLRGRQGAAGARQLRAGRGRRADCVGRLLRELPELEGRRHQPHRCCASTGSRSSRCRRWVCRRPTQGRVTAEEAAALRGRPAVRRARRWPLSPASR